MTAINLGRWSPDRLIATYPHTPGAPSTCAYLVLLRVEIARFTLVGLPLRALLPDYVSVALILTSRWRAVSSYAALCSPDVPPVRCFHPTQALAFRLAPAAVWRTSRAALSLPAHGWHSVLTTVSRCCRPSAPENLPWTPASATAPSPSRGTHTAQRQQADHG